MRYAPEHKEATRRRLVETAGRRLKSDGIDGSGVATLVADAGLTNGAFYGHFDSKDHLVATVVSQQLADQVARVEALPVGPSSVEAFLQDYLSPAHRDDPAGGCPSAALLDEIGRRDDATRQGFADGARAMIAAVAHHLASGGAADPEDTAAPGDPEMRAVGVYALAVGALQLARAIPDTQLSDRVLAAAYENAVALVRGREPGPDRDGGAP